MSEAGGRIEKLLERYVLGELSDDDRRLVEDYLSSSSEEAQQARDELKIEQALIDALDIERGEVDVADRVLERVFRRPDTQTRASYRPGLAGKILREARDEGHISAPRGRLWSTRVQRIASVAAGLLFFVALIYGSAALRPEDDRRPLRIFDPNLVGEVSVLPFEEGRDFENIPRTPAGRVGRPLRVGDEITTDARELAVLEVQEGQGRLALPPLSRVRIIRERQGGPISLKLLEGGFHFDFSRMSGSIPVETDKGHRGRVTGRGQVLIASRSLGFQRPALENSLGQLILVQVGAQSSATFDGPEGDVRAARGQLLIVGPESVMTVAENPLDALSSRVQASWRVDEHLRDATQPVLRLGTETLVHGDFAAEALRVYKHDLMELLATSFLVESELDRLGISPNEADIADATRFLRNDEVAQILPLRSADARRARRDQLAGLRAIDRELLRRAGKKIPRGSIIAARQRVWQRLASKLEIRRGDKEDLAFEFRFDERSLKVTRGEAWANLRRYLRVSEIDRILKQDAEQGLLDIWLRQRGESWPGEPKRFASHFVTMAQMSAMTRVQLHDRLQIEKLILGVVQPPSQAQLERFMMENVTKRRRLMFQHYFFPTTDPFRGFSLPAEKAKEAEAAARRCVEMLRAGETPEIEQPAPRFLGSIWRNGVTGGPRPWWNEIYGRDFTLAVSSLSTGEVSEPIRSPEGWHVVKMQHEGKEASDPRAHRSYAMLLYRYELARRLFDDVVSQQSERLVDPADLLR